MTKTDAALPDTWRIVPVGSVCSLQGGFAFKSDEFRPSGIPIVRISNVKERGLDWRSEVFWSEDLEPRIAKFLLQEKDILISMTGNVGETCMVRTSDLPALLNQRVGRFKIPDPNVLDEEYLLFVSKTSSFRQAVSGGAYGAVQQNVSGKGIESAEIPLPPLPEQKKIAHILSTVQRAIEAQERIIQTTTELKKALMHKLFTEGLRHEPQKQTEIGPVPESWEVVELGALAKVGNGSTPKRGNEAYWAGGAIPWLNSTKIHDRFITEADQFVTPQAVKECHLPKVAPNSLLIAITGQGKTLGNSAITRIETCINQHLAYAQFHAAKIVPDFVLWFMQTRYDYLRSIAHGGGSTKGALTCGFLKTLPIPVPSRVEQEEIAFTLQTLEDKKQNAARKQAALQDLFRTLLHQLMTAQIRVGGISHLPGPSI